MSEFRDPRAVRRALGFFKVMAVVVGIGLLILTLEVVLHYGFQNESLAWWSPIHGVLFMAYVVSVANLGFKVGWSLGRMVRLMLAGMVPLLSFWVERQVAREVEPRLAGSLAR